MDLVPTLSRHGYEWVIVDSEHVRPVTPMSWEELRYRPHRARSATHEIIVVVRDRELSNAQESGMEAGWFIEEVRARTQHCDFPPLVTTATDGDNGGWFRNTTQARTSGAASTASSSSGCAPGSRAASGPAFISDYLDRYGAHGWVTVDPARGTRASTTATGFVQWTGSQAQRDALARVAQLSEAVRAARNALGGDARPPSSWSRPGGGYYAPRPAATSSGARPGCSAATTTSTPRPRTLTRRCTRKATTSSLSRWQRERDHDRSDGNEKPPGPRPSSTCMAGPRERGLGFAGCVRPRASDWLRGRRSAARDRLHAAVNSRSGLT